MPLLVKDLMVADVMCVPRTATVTEVSQLLREHNVNGAPVVDENGNPVGVISRTDLVSGWVQAETQGPPVYYRSAAGEPPAVPGPAPATGFGSKRVGEVMMSFIFGVQQQDPVRKAAELMAAEGIHRVLVMDGKRLVGIVSASDIVKAVAQGRLVPAP